MVSACRGLLAATLWLAIALHPGGAFATYVFTYPTVPSGTVLGVWGINNVGQAAENVQLSSGLVFAGIYESGLFNPLPVPPPGLALVATGINDARSVVGAVFAATGSFSEQGFILSGGSYTFFSKPGWANTEPRAIGNSGLVTGVAYTDQSSLAGSVGFIYNPVTGVFTDIAPPNSLLTIAQGINVAGQVVGSYFSDVSPLGETAFLRQPDGTIDTFRVDNRETQARSINDNGLIAGFIEGGGTVPQGFVGNSSGFELLSVPGATATFPEGLNNAGQVSGTYYDAAGNSHGFIAYPVSLPSGTTAGGAYTFDVSVVPNVMIFIDPTVSLGFDYEIGTGDPKFASVQLPIGIGDSLYTLIVHGQAFALAGGDTFDFAAHGFANGVAQFRVADIEASAGLDPNNAAAFPTGLTFIAAGTFTGTMTPLCRSKPLPHQANAPVGRALSPCLSQ